MRRLHTLSVRRTRGVGRLPLRQLKLELHELEPHRSDVFLAIDHGRMSTQIVVCGGVCFESLRPDSQLGDSGENRSVECHLVVGEHPHGAEDQILRGPHPGVGWQWLSEFGVLR